MNAPEFTYYGLDQAKIAGQQAARQTDFNAAGADELFFRQSRGESALVFGFLTHYLAVVQEGLGTKNLVAEATGASLESAAWDTVAMIVNDLITSGARPVIVNAHWAVGDPSYFSPERAHQLAQGWASACTEAGAVYGAGETPALSGIIDPGTIELSGSGVGIIQPKSRLITENALAPGDHIILVASSGIHANGLTDARRAAGQLPESYETQLPDGRTYGEVILTPTIIYARMVMRLLDHGIYPHYLVNITGHGFRKLMRATRNFTYRLQALPPVQPEFDLIGRTLRFSAEKMYATYNMGAGFAVYVSPADSDQAIEVIKTAGYSPLFAGVVESGPKQVVIEPLDVTYSADSIKIR